VTKKIWDIFGIYLGYIHRCGELWYPGMQRPGGMFPAVAGTGSGPRNQPA
jgi:hypothetical protein